MGSQEAMAKPPPGYRAPTADEERALLEQGLAKQIYGARVAQHQAEIRAAEAELAAAKCQIKDALSQLALAHNQVAAFNQQLGIKGVPGDIVELGGKVYILVDPACRIDPAKPVQITVPPPGKG